MKSSYFLALVLLLASCSPQKRLSRLVEKYPELAKDSQAIKITEREPGETLDTFISDTIKPTGAKNAHVQNHASINISLIDSSVKVPKKYNLPSKDVLKTSVKPPIFFHKGNLSGSITETDSGIHLHLDEAATVKDTVVKTPLIKVVESSGVSTWWRTGVIIFLLLLLIACAYGAYKRFS